MKNIDVIGMVASAFAAIVLVFCIITADYTHDGLEACSDTTTDFEYCGY